MTIIYGSIKLSSDQIVLAKAILDQKVSVIESKLKASQSESEKNFYSVSLDQSKTLIEKVSKIKPDDELALTESELQRLSPAAARVRCFNEYVKAADAGDANLGVSLAAKLDGYDKFDAVLMNPVVDEDALGDEGGASVRPTAKLH